MTKFDKVIVETQDIYHSIQSGVNTLNALRKVYPALHESSLKRRLFTLSVQGKIRYLRRPEWVGEKVVPAHTWMVT